MNKELKAIKSRVRRKAEKLGAEIEREDWTDSVTITCLAPNGYYFSGLGIHQSTAFAYKGKDQWEIECWEEIEEDLKPFNGVTFVKCDTPDDHCDEWIDDFQYCGAWDL